MTYIITILIVVFICLCIWAFNADDSDSVKVLIAIASTCIVIGTVLIIWNAASITAEDYLNNPAAYQLDTIGTHINVSKLIKK